MPGLRPLGVQRLDELLEGQVLVGVGGQVRLADAADQLLEGGVAGGVGAQDEGVDEEADEVVEGVVGAARDRGAERDVGAGAEPGEEGGDGGLEHHERAGLGGTRQGADPPVQRFGDLVEDAVPAVAGDGGPGPVRGQRQFLGEPGQGPLPVGELADGLAVRVVLGAQRRALPEAVVGVLDGQRGPGGAPPACRAAYAVTRSRASSGTDQPSPAMWWTSSRRTFSSGPVSNSQARRGISSSSAKGWAAAAASSASSRLASPTPGTRVSSGGRRRRPARSGTGPRRPPRRRSAVPRGARRRRRARLAARPGRAGR